jgi:hypothetical protein
MPTRGTLHVRFYPSFQGSLRCDEMNLLCHVELSLEKSSSETNFSLSRNLDVNCLVGRTHRITYNTWRTFNLRPPISVTSRSFHFDRNSGPVIANVVWCSLAPCHVIYCISKNSRCPDRTSLVSDIQQHNFGVD